MRFLTTVLVLGLVASSSLVAAQNSTTPVPPPGQEAACSTCLAKNVLAIPDCAKVDVNPSQGVTDPSKLSDADKKCLCTLVSDLSWATKCNGADMCGAELIAFTANSLGPIKAQNCPAGGAGASGKSNANALTGSNSKAAMAALAVGAVLAAL
ncbi:hypothetical protein KVV02_005538 [Mortierella alpina]|uniref:Extracellular membrane protein CFEM domain-containing protein n=1 Tax=Mortierella alpina TaxID=64518 RepID=A0A9P8A3N1_MORAP|nr:hypothetical protein KVV02_005538 [Mortierella alpina]